MKALDSICMHKPADMLKRNEEKETISMKQDLIVILDLGSTQNTVIAREIRELGVYSEIHPHDIIPKD